MGFHFDIMIFEAECRHNKTCRLKHTCVCESGRFLKWRCYDRKAFVKTAGGGGRTHNLKLGKLALCQLSYARVFFNYLSVLLFSFILSSHFSFLSRFFTPSPLFRLFTPIRAVPTRDVLSVAAVSFLFLDFFWFFFNLTPFNLLKLCI